MPATAVRRRPEGIEGALTWVVVALAGVAGALADAEPVGWGPGDLVWRAGFAAVVAAAAAVAPRWTWIVLGAVAAAGADGGWVLCGGAALAVAVVASIPRERTGLLGAVVAALAVPPLLHMDLDATGASALVAALAVLPVLLAAYLQGSSTTRRRVKVAVGGLVGVAVLATVGLAVATVQSYQQVRDAATDIRSGLDAVRDNRPQRAVALLEAAAEDLEEANGAVTTWGLPARLVPVLGHQARAVEVVTGSGADLAATAAQATVDADLDELGFDDGAIDLTLVTGFEEPLADAYAALDAADGAVTAARTPWLVDPLSSGVADFAEEVDRALPDAELAIEGVRVAPALFGGEGERRYLIIFTQPAEARGLSGFVGNFGELTAVDGDLELTRSGRIRELNDAPGADQRTLSGPPDYLARYGRFRPAQFLQDLAFSPDGPTVGQVWEELYPQTGAQPVQGTIMVDPYALAALMEFTGPITVPGLDTPLTSDNAADILVRQQYLTFQDDREERIDFLDDATRLTFERLTEGDLPGPRRVAEVLGPLVRQGRLVVHAVDDEEQAFMVRTGLDGALPPVQGDFLSLVTQNSANNKIDLFLERTVDHRVTWDPATGRVEADVTVALRNTAPADGLPGAVIGSSDDTLPLGTNRLYLSLYSPFDLTGFRLQGRQAGIEANDELGRRVYSRFLEIPPGATVRLAFRLEGAVAPGTTYRLDVAPQPLVNPDRVRVRVTPTDDWSVTEAVGLRVTPRGAAGRGGPVEDTTYTVTADRP